MSTADQSAARAELANTVSDGLERVAAVARTLSGMANHAASIADKRRPGMGEHYAREAASARTAAAMLGELSSDLRYGNRWVTDREQLAAYLAMAREAAGQAGYVLPEVAELVALVTGETPEQTAPELCPNGQPIPTECREIDPCEMCQQDIDAEGDMIEASMNLR